MERLAELISKLKEQFEQKADSSKLLATTLLIERELMKTETVQAPQAPAFAGSMISVVMPADRNGYHQRYSDALPENEEQAYERRLRQHARSEPEPVPQPVVGPESVRPQSEPVPEPKVKPESVRPEPVARSGSAAAPQPVARPESAEQSQPVERQEAAVRPELFGRQERIAGNESSKFPPVPPLTRAREFAVEADEYAEQQREREEAAKLALRREAEANKAYEKQEPAETKESLPEFTFDPLIEIPTLSQQHSVKEINEIIGIRDASLNDKLKENKKEIGHILKDHPIRDLKKAIGVNDRYVFINELFRGDEVMYERSLKTINGFRIFAEAEYWIERELKVKLGWEEHKETTRLFYDLIRRRFS